MAYLRDQVIVLRREPYRDHDRRYLVFGRDLGMRSVMARGCARPSSRQAGHLEPLQLAEVMIAPGKGFDHLAVARTPQPFFSADHPTYGRSVILLQALTDVIGRLMHPGMADPRIFLLYAHVVALLQQAQEEETSISMGQLLAVATWALLSLSGFVAQPDQGVPEEVREVLAGASWESPMNLRSSSLPLKTRELLLVFVAGAFGSTPMEEPPPAWRFAWRVLSH